MAPRTRLRLRASAMLTTLAWLVAACAEPALVPDPATDGDDAPPVAEESTDTTTDQLAGEIAAVRATVGEALDELAAAETADGLPAARSAADRALALLLADSARPGTTRALLPSESADREVAGSQADGLTSLLILARDGGGRLADRTLEVLRDPVAGDLGAWERDAAGVVAGVRATIEGPQDLEELEAAVRDLPGDATSALAWTLLATEAPDQDRSAEYAERAAVHLEFVAMALDGLIGEPAPDDTGTG